MPTVTATLKTGSGLPIAATVRFWMPDGPGQNLSGHLVSSGVITTDTDPETGDLSVTLEPGRWVMTWPNGASMNRLTVAVPVTPGTYEIAELVEGSPIISSPVTKWYDTIEIMLASDSRLYANATTRNSYDTDGIISGWSRVLKSSDEATGLTDNGDQVLESHDGYAFWVRNWISS